GRAVALICISSNLSWRSWLVSEASRRAGRGSHPELGPRPALRRDGDHEMTQEQKISRAKVGLLEWAKQLGNVSQACKMMGYSRDQLLPLQGAVRQRRRAGAAGDQPQEADPEEPHPAGDRTGGGRDGGRAAGLGPGSDLGSAKAARLVDLTGRRALRLAAPRPDLDEAAPQGARRRGGAGGHFPDRGADHR